MNYLFERVLSRMLLEGRGLSVGEVHDIMFGSGEPAAALKSFLKMAEEGELWNRELEDYRQQLAAQFMPAFEALKNSQEAKALLNDPGVDANITWQENADPIEFIRDNYHKIPIIKRALKVRSTVGKKGRGSVALGSKKWLKNWKNTNGYGMPDPEPEHIIDLEPYRLQERTILYRGIRFREVVDLLDFAEKYGDGKRPFPFQQNKPSAWTKSKKVAERFATMSAAGSEFEAMMQWANRAKSGKNYSEHGGYIIGAIVRPEDTIVDFDNISVSSQHGSEGEVIVKAGVQLTCKIYQLWGDIPREIEEFGNLSWGREEPKDFYYGYGIQKDSIEGDSESGVVKFSLRKEDMFNIPDQQKSRFDTPRKYDQETGGKIVKQFRKQLYDAVWLDDYTVSYTRRAGINLPPIKKR